MAKPCQISKEKKVEKVEKEISNQEKPKTNGETNQVRQVKKVVAEPSI